ncbi:MAG: hypothetical protein IJT58_07055 [Synergistaceae bacterium]|nr:hypothetical protein [Synergistaceae bacterium]
MKTYLTIFGKPRYLGFTNINDDRILNDLERHNAKWLVLKTFRGYEMGLPGGVMTPEQVEKYKSETITFEDSTEMILQDVDFIREADAEDIINYHECRQLERDALPKARALLSGHEIKIKLVDVEYMLDRKKVFFYFTAEQRIDFRAYVRDLAHEFKTRIEMRQIGIRDEARIVKGIASCGRPCCCGYWLRGFSPISIKIVKEQRSALNPTKISGLCGRLMCCMSYEQELYSELWEKLPGPGAKIRTEQGTYILESLDLGREQVNIRFPTGRLVPVLISEFPDFQASVLKGEEWGVDKELAEKQKAAKARIERIEKAKREMRERSGVRVNARSLRPSTTREAPANANPAAAAKPKRKPNKQAANKANTQQQTQTQNQTQSQNQSQSPNQNQTQSQNHNQRRRRPRPKPANKS